MKTQAEIDAQITALENIKDKVTPTSFFGDNHLDAIDAQIRVLEEDLESDEIEEEFEPGPHNVVSAALDARDWIDGESDIEDLAADYPLQSEEE